MIPAIEFAATQWSPHALHAAQHSPQAQAPRLVSNSARLHPSVVTAARDGLEGNEAVHTLAPRRCERLGCTTHQAAPGRSRSAG